MKKSLILCAILFTGVLLALSLRGATRGHSASKGCSLYTQTTAPPCDTVSEFGKSVLIIFQASNGEHWFGSHVDGVYRYDGKIIRHYTTRHGLCNNTIREIKEDRSGNIFFSTQHGGVSKFDGKTFTTLPVFKSVHPESDWKLKEGDLWFVGETGKNGPYRYDGKTLHHVEFPKHTMEDAYYAASGQKAWSPYEVYRIYQDKRGHVWFGTSNFGICRYDGVALSWMYEDQLQFVPGGGSFGIRSILEDKAGKFWFCNTRYRYVVSPKGLTGQENEAISYKKETGIAGIRGADGSDFVYFMSVIEDQKGELWMATYGDGVWRYDGKKVLHYPVKDGSKPANLYSVYQDREGTLWLGSHESGVFKFNGKTFEKFRL